MAILKVVLWGVSLVVAGWYLCITFVSSYVKLVVGEYLVGCVYSHLYLLRDSSVGEDVAPDGRCTPILLKVILFHVVLGGTCVVYEVVRARESLFGSFSVSSM